MRIDPEVDYRSRGFVPPEKCRAFAVLYRGIVARTGSVKAASARLRGSSNLLTDIMYAVVDPRIRYS